MLIITADDFGLHEAINEAVEIAHRDGILTTASLMVAAPAAEDALARARRLPDLKVGLHVVLVDGTPCLPPQSVPELVGRDGRFRNAMAWQGARMYFLPAVRRALAREIRAQFEAFAQTGLVLDHVNTHKHFHLHPTILEMIVSIGRDFGLRAVRLPAEAGAALWLRPWLARVRRRLDAAGLAHNDYVVGIAASGHVDEQTLLTALRCLPEGNGEIYLHPAVAAGAPLTKAMRDYRHADELAALLSPQVAQCLAERAIQLGSFSDLRAA